MRRMQFNVKVLVIDGSMTLSAMRGKSQMRTDVQYRLVVIAGMLSRVVKCMIEEIERL